MPEIETAPESAAPVTPKLEPSKSTIGAARALIQRPDNQAPWPPPPQIQSERYLAQLIGQTDYYRFINDSGEFCVKSLNEVWGKMQLYPSFCPNRCASRVTPPDERQFLAARWVASNPNLDHQCANALDLQLPLRTAIWNGENRIFFLYSVAGLSPDAVRSALKAIDLLGGDVVYSRNLLSPIPTPDSIQPIRKRALINAKAMLFKSGLTAVLGYQSHIVPAYERRALVLYLNGGSE
jgi:hypothetical protein